MDELPSGADFQQVAFQRHAPFEGWRRISPMDSIGLPAVSINYIEELHEMAHERGITVADGSTLTAQYRRVDGEWFPIPETVEARNDE